MVPGSIQRPSFTHFRAQARKWLQEASRDSQIKPGGAKKDDDNDNDADDDADDDNNDAADDDDDDCDDDDADRPGMAPGSLQGPIFFAISKPKPENYPRKPPEAQFYPFPSPT